MECVTCDADDTPSVNVTVFCFFSFHFFIFHFVKPMTKYTVTLYGVYTRTHRVNVRYGEQDWKMFSYFGYIVISTKLNGCVENNVLTL